MDQVLLNRVRLLGWLLPSLWAQYKYLNGILDLVVFDIDVDRDVTSSFVVNSSDPTIS